MTKNRCATCKRTDSDTTFRTRMQVYCDECVATWDLSPKYQGEDDAEPEGDE